MLKNLHFWLGSYIKQSFQRLNSKQPRSPLHILFCFVDHFEPDWNNASMNLQKERVETWLKEYPKVATLYKDADGSHPKHTFFYPAEVYQSERLDQLKKLCDQNFGEVEIHLHHDNDTQEGFREKLRKAKSDFSQHGMLAKDKQNGQTRFGFIHGNWALNNSREDGKWCGVNNELAILREEGCYADFTLPSAPSDTQTSKINSIYYALGKNEQTKSHDTGVDVEVGKKPSGDLMMIQGPLALNWTRRKWGILPRIENSDVAAYYPVAPHRIDLWQNQNVHVKGRSDWVFIKVHTHGASEKNANYLFKEGFQTLFSSLDKIYNDQKKSFLHYVTAREMYNIIKAAENGLEGNPGQYRDYLLNRV